MSQELPVVFNNDALAHRERANDKTTCIHENTEEKYYSVGKMIGNYCAALCFSVVLVSVTSSIMDQILAPGDEEFLQEDVSSMSAQAIDFARRLLDMKEHEELHRPLHPIETRDIYGFACASLGLMVAAGGGIGGGGMLVPIYILILGFSPKYAIPLSNVTVFGGALANTLLNWRKRHPLADRPLIDWDLILVMEPLTISGALMGALLNKVLPEKILVISLVLLLSFTGFNTLTKANKMYKKETIQIRQAELHDSKGSELTKLVRQQEDEDEGETSESLLDNMESSEFGPMETIIDNNLATILEEERTMPFSKIKALVVMFIVVLVINVMKGGGAFKSPLGITCGSVMFWIANVALLVWIGVVSIFARNVLVKQFHEKEAANYKYVEGDIKWDERATVVYPFVCMFAGT